VIDACVAKLRSDKGEQSKMLQRHHEVRIGEVAKKLGAARERLAYEQNSSRGGAPQKGKPGSLWRRILPTRKAKTTAPRTPPRKVAPVWQPTSETVAQLEQKLQRLKDDHGYKQVRQQLEQTKKELREHVGSTLGTTSREALRSAARWISRVRVPRLRRRWCHRRGHRERRGKSQSLCALGALRGELVLVDLVLVF